MLIATIANLLVDELEVSQLEDLLEIALDHTETNALGDMWCRIQAFMINGLFRKYNCFDCDNQIRMEDAFLPVIQVRLFEGISRL
jgi:hypothetical protein